MTNQNDRVREINVLIQYHVKRLSQGTLHRGSAEWHQRKVRELEDERRKLLREPKLWKRILIRTKRLLHLA